VNDEFCDLHPRVRLVSVVDEGGFVSRRCVLCDIADKAALSPQPQPKPAESTDARLSKGGTDSE
jgi:hypothetical protein